MCAVALQEKAQMRDKNAVVSLNAISIQELLAKESQRPLP